MSEGASMGDLIEGVERFVVDEVAKCKLQHSKFQKAVESRMKDIEHKLGNVDAEQKHITTSLEQMERKVNEMNAHTKITDKINETQMSDLNKRMDDMKEDVAQLNPNVIRELTGKINTIKHSFKSTVEALDDFDAMDEDRQEQSQPTPSLPSPPLSFVPPKTFYGNRSTETMRPETVNALQNFMSPTNKSDKLTQIQSAFFKMFMNEHQTNKIGDMLVNNCSQQGVEMGVWDEEFTPEGVSDFAAYLKERMRNHRKYEKKTALKRNQRKRLSDYLEKSVADAEEPMQVNL